METRQNAVLSGLFDTSQELVLMLNGFMGSVVCWNVATITYQVKTYTVTVMLLEGKYYFNRLTKKLSEQKWPQKLCHYDISNSDAFSMRHRQCSEFYFIVE